MKSLLFVCALLVPFSLSAGEKPAVYLTGNRQVDFFGGSGAPLAPANHPMSLQELSGSSGGGEKSPWLAGALSLVLPGAGEVYTENYLKGAVFFAAEAASWFVAYTYDKKGNDQTDLFKAYANAHWSATRYTDWTLNHLGTLNPGLTADYRSAIYDDPADQPPCDPPFDCINWAALNDMERDVAAGPTNGYTHVLPYYGEQQYYELIGKYEQFSRGWDDSDPASPLEDQLPIRSTSARFFEYSKMRAQANNYYDVASTFVSIVVLNHILSAADAYWSATRFNKSLHADLRMKMQRTRYGYVPMTQASFKYDF